MAYAECQMLNVIMLNVIMLNVIMLNVIMLNVVMLNVIMLNVVVPFHPSLIFQVRIEPIRVEF